MSAAQLSREELDHLVEVARAAIAGALTGRVEALPPSTAPGRLARMRRGVFVSVYVRGELRGCIGSVEPAAPLIELTGRMALAAARSDPRFPPLRPEELDDLEIEISLLTPPEPLRSLADLEIGRHGVIVRQGPRRAVMLPQVAPRLGWDAATLLTQTSRKAGLPGDAWRRGAEVLTFEAQVYKSR